jgi:hypothetical protein
VTQAFEGRDIQENKLLATVQGWFENWSSLGWFCAPNSTDQDCSSESGRQS